MLCWYNFVLDSLAGPAFWWIVKILTICGTASLCQLYGGISSWSSVLMDSLGGLDLWWSA